MSRPPATVSVDLDPVDLHLVGYGHAGLPPDPLVYSTALPRLLDRFARFGMRATVFAVGRDAEARRDDLATIVAEKHEIASHSLTHPLGFARLPRARLEAELADSRRRLGAATGADVAGFRAPNFDLEPATLAAVAAAGYRYDASAYPTPLLLVTRVLLALKSGDPGAVLAMRPWPFSMERLPARRAAGSGTLVEFPAAVTPLLRWPVYHTIRFVTPAARFLRLLDGFADRGEPLSYTLHAVDALGLVEDGVDRRLAPHPGMERPLAEKLAMLDECLERIAARFECLPFAARLGELGGTEYRPASGV
jgi:predicted deacetylase